MKDRAFGVPAAETMSGDFTQLAVETPEGAFVASYNHARGLCSLRFPTARSAAVDPPKPVPAQVAAWHRLTASAVRSVLAGLPLGELPPLDLSSGTAFQQAVWAALRELGPGQTASYGEIARRIKRPGAARAVGAACGANPIPLLVPCHRVLASGTKLGGFSGGLHWKRTLLEREGIRVVG